MVGVHPVDSKEGPPQVEEIPIPKYTECATDESLTPSTPSSSRRSSCKGIGKKAASLFPIIDWLPKYKWRENLHGDIIAGLTVGIMHVPQGMAYSSLAGLPPIYGLYSSFFASTFYMFFGTSRHISIGCFAVASMMVGVVEHNFLPNGDNPGNATTPLGADNPWADVTTLELASALTLLVGLVQIVMGLARLGFITSYLSDPLISGFTTGAAFHVLVSQVNKVFGVTMPRHSGTGMVILILWDIAKSLPETNFMALGISLFGIIFLSIGRDYVNPIVKKHSPVPLPLELILVIIGTVFSIIMGLKVDYDIKIVDTIPRGFPVPAVPRFSLLPALIMDAIPIAVICYIFVVSMGKLFARKHKYRTDPIQEMYAAGLMSILSSFFPVYPVGASLSRSAVCEMSGVKTLLYTVFSSLLLLTVILFLGPLLEPLPMCILACIVIVSLKSLFMQCTELPRLWKISKYDFAIWIVACLSTIMCDVTKGLIISIAFAILTIVLREQWPNFDDHRVPLASERIPEHVKVLKFDSPLHFANVTLFTDTLMDVVQSNNEEKSEPRTVIVDCSAVSYVDTMAVDAIKNAYQEASKENVTLFFTGLNGSILQMLEEIKFEEIVPKFAFQPSPGEVLRNNVI